MEDTERLTALRKHVRDVAIPLANDLRFAQTSRLDLTRIAIFCSLLEQSEAVATLVERGLGYHAYPILRTQLEAYADLTNLCKECTYLKHFEIELEETNRRKLIAVKSGNPYLHEVRQVLDVEKEISDVGQRIKALEKKHAKKLEPKLKFRKANLAREYEVLYPTLCEHAHGGLGALIARHVREDNGVFRVVAFSPNDSTKFGAVIEVSFDILLRASLAVHECFGTAHVDHFQRLIQERGKGV